LFFLLLNINTLELLVIMLSTTDDLHEVDQRYKLRCNIYITKPVAYSALRMTLIGGKILIVDDEEGAASLQQIRLKRFGHQVTLAYNIEDALVKLDQSQFDLLILDYTLGGELSGLDFYIIVRDRGLAVPAILVTGFEDERVILKAMRSGVRDFLPKSLDYLEDLPMAVERVLKQSRLERQLIESESLREKQEQLKDAFEAAQMGYWDWDLQTGTLAWSGYHQELFGFSTGQLVTTFEDFSSKIVPEDKVLFINALSQSEKTGGEFDQIFRIKGVSGGERWLQAKGRYISGPTRRRMTAVVLDVTDTKQAELVLEHSYEQIQALNERLKLSVTETHHRVKNSLQTLGSLVNLQSDDHEALSPEGVQKIISHLHGIAAVHDALTSRSREDNGEGGVDVTIIPVLERVISIVSKLGGERGVITDLDSCRDCRVSPRHASSLAVIVNELFSNAIKYGAGRIWIAVKRLSNGTAELTFENEGSQFPAGFSLSESTRTGLYLLNALCLSDFQSEAKFFNSAEGRACVSIIFSLWQPEDPRIR
jgi:PAS domain S-box-containing protein